jgi:hypothetical protein
MEPQVVRSIKEALPPELLSDANAKALEASVLHAYWQAVFGPGDPLLTDLLMHPDLAERKFHQRVGAAVSKTLDEQFGDKLSVDQRHALTRRVIAVLTALAQTKSKAASATGNQNSDDNDNSAVAGLLFAVKMPGKVVTTNGEVDEVDGDVFWGLYPEAAALGDVEMKAVCEVPARSASR